MDYQVTNAPASILRHLHRAPYYKDPKQHGALSYSDILWSEDDDDDGDEPDDKGKGKAVELLDSQLEDSSHQEDEVESDGSIGVLLYSNR